MPIIPKQSDKTISTIKLFVAYDYNGNTVYFDNLSLVADNAVSYKYDDNGNVTTATSSNKSEVNATYSGADLTGYTAATGAEYTYTYDDAHNVTSATWAGVTNNLTYTAAGLVKGSTLTDGKNTIKTTAAYDYYGKLTSETDQLGRTETYNYNSSNGSLELDIFPDNSRMVNRTTASNNRPYQVYYDVPGTGYESTVNLSYSKGRVSQIQQKTSGSSSVSQTYGLSYNSFGDLTKFTVGNITLSQNTYNQYTGNILTSLSPSGATLSYSYDILGRQTGVLSGGTTLFTTKYNAQGNIAKVTDAVNGLVTEYMYDSIGRTKNAIVYDTSNVFKQLTQYRYDDANRLKRRFFTLDFHAGSYEDFTYDTNGLLTKKVPSTGDALTLEYNSLKQVDRVKVEHESNSALTFYKDYDYKTVSGTRTSNLPEKIKYLNNNSVNLLTYTYVYDNMNNITTVKRTAPNGVNYIDASYTYDDFGKLVDAAHASDYYSYAYDKLGNITEIDKTVGGVNSTLTLGYDTTSGWRDRLVSVNGTAITYGDTAPGLPATYYNGNKSYRFTWNDLGQLEAGLIGTKLFTCQYNSDGLRTFKRANGKNHYYYYDGDRLIAEKLITGYILFHYDENDSIYCITYNNGTTSSKYYLIKNLQGDVVQIWDSNNNVVAKYSYDPWGNIVSIIDVSGADISADTTHIAYINPIRYRSYYYDAEFGFYYLQSRYYDPAIGRFISADVPTVATDSSTVTDKNLFAYCDNNPVTRVDDGGQFWDTIFDVISLGTSIADVCSDPSDGWAWAGLAGDVIDLIPFVSGVGEATKAARAVVKAADVLEDAGDTIQIAKAVDFTEDAADLVKSLDRSSGYTKSTASAGRKIHAGYKATKGFNPDWKEYKRIKGIRPDYIDFNTKTIYELKPMNPRNIKSGVRQLKKYNRALGGGYNLRLELY